MSFETYQRPTFEIDGVTYRLAKATPKRSNKVRDFFREIMDNPDAKDEIEVMKETLSLIGDVEQGNPSNIDFENVDRNKIMHYLKEGFLG